MKRLFLNRKIHFNENYPCLGIQDEMEATPDGHKDDFFEWFDRRGSVHWTTTWIWNTFNRKTHVCILKRILYGLKQAPRAWYGRIDGFSTRLGFTKSKADSNLYYNVVDDRIMILLIDVNDILLKGEQNIISDCKKKLA